MCVNSIGHYVFTITSKCGFNESVLQNWNYIFLSTILTVSHLEKSALSCISSHLNDMRSDTHIRPRAPGGLGQFRRTSASLYSHRKPLMNSQEHFVKVKSCPLQVILRAQTPFQMKTLFFYFMSPMLCLTPHPGLQGSVSLTGQESSLCLF